MVVELVELKHKIFFTNASVIGMKVLSRGQRCCHAALVTGNLLLVEVETIDTYCFSTKHRVAPGVCSAHGVGGAILHPPVSTAEDVVLVDLFSWRCVLLLQTLGVVTGFKSGQSAYLSQQKRKQLLRSDSVALSVC